MKLVYNVKVDDYIFDKLIDILKTVDGNINSDDIDKITFYKNGAEKIKYKEE